MGIFIILLLLKGMLMHFSISERHGGAVVSTLDSGSRGPGSSPGRVIFVVFLGKTLYSPSASLHPGV